jgi:hypothetical protein
MANHPKMLRHVGLLFNEPPGNNRGALQPVIRPTSIQIPANLVHWADFYIVMRIAD